MATKVFFCVLVCLVVGTFALKGKQKAKKDLEKRQVPGECGPTEFMCRNHRCIQLEWTCDTDNDCGDHSDEIDCPPESECSGPHQFHCNNTRCIPSEFHCDGDNDCNDGSDEADCATFECPIAEIKCSNNLCIEVAYMCDGDNDCGNGWDEVQANCANV